MGTVLEARGLVVRRGQHTVLRGADLSLDGGTCTLLLGENGTGKSTLMETLLGLHPLEEGAVLAQSKVVRDAEGRRARRPHLPLGVLLQSDGSVRDQSVRHHLRVCASAAGVDVSDEALAELTQRMDLRHRLDDRMLSLSEGQRRKVCVLGALLPGLVHGRESLLVLDEPMAALDERGRIATVALVAEVMTRGATVLIGTHHPERFPLANQAYVLNEGQLQPIDQEGTASHAEMTWPDLTGNATRPSPWGLGRRYAWSGGTPLSGAVLGVLMTLALATLLFDASSVDALPPTAVLGSSSCPRLWPVPRGRGLVDLEAGPCLPTLVRPRSPSARPAHSAFAGGHFPSGDGALARCLRDDGRGRCRCGRGAPAQSVRRRCRCAWVEAGPP